MFDTLSDQVIQGIGNKFIQYLSESEGLEPESELRFLMKHFQPLLAASLTRLDLSPQKIKDAFIRMLIKDEQYGLDALFQDMAKSLLSDRSLGQSWSPHGHSIHSPPFGQTPKPGSHGSPS